MSEPLGVESMAALMRNTWFDDGSGTGTSGDVSDTFGAIKGQADNTRTAAENVGTQVEYVQQVIAVRSGVGIWESGPDPTGVVSFPYALLALHAHTASVTVEQNGNHSHSVGGTTGSTTVSGSSHSHGSGSLNASSNGRHDHPASAYIGMPIPTLSATATYAPWASVRFPSATARKAITYLAAASGAVSAFYLDVYQQLPDGSSLLVWSSGNQAGVLPTSLGWVQTTLPNAISTDIGDVYEVQFRMSGSGSVILAGINLPYPIPLLGYRPYAPGSGRDPSSSPAPSTIATNVRDTMYAGPTPWVSFGVQASVATGPRYFYDDFNRSGLGSRWTTWGGDHIKPVDNKLIFDSAWSNGGGTEGAMYAQPTISDAVTVEFDVTDSAGAVGAGMHNATQLTAGAWAIVSGSSSFIQSGSYESRTTRATGTDGGDGHYAMTFTTSDSTYRLVKEGVEVASWVDSGGVVSRGMGRRWLGLMVSKGFPGSSGKLDNWTAYDVVS